MKKKLVSALYTLSLLSTMVFAPQAKAKLSFRDFKNVTRHFKNGKEYNSPTLGQALLESGVVYDLRFDWDFESAYDQNDNRNPIRDHSPDPTWNLTKILFPSPAGELAVTTAAATNFGNRVNSPETVAILLNFANQVRAKEQKFRVQMQRQMKQKNFETEEEYFAWAQTTGAKKNLFSKKELDQLTDRLLKSMGMDQANKNEKIDLKQRSINPLLASIQGSIEEEYKPGTLIPMHLTEEILNAFFVQKFNSQDDILALLRNLDDDLVDKSSLPEKLEKLEEEDLPLIAKKDDPLDYDDFYALAHTKSFFEMTPYPDGTPVSNQSAYLYDRKEDRLVETETFPDCVETSMRHLMNLLLYDAESKTFQVDQLKKRFPVEQYPYLKNLFDFYELQSSEDSNSGTINLRSAWNRVVADLNADDESPHQIHYRENGNNIAAGWGNMIHVFGKLFKLELGSLPENGDLGQRKEWIANSLKTIFQAINPERKYEIEFDSGKYEVVTLRMKVDVLVPPQKDENHFSFEFQGSLAHMMIENIKGTREGQYIDYSHDLARKAKTSEINNGAEDILWRLTPKKIADNHIKPTLFKLFSSKLNDAESRIDFIGSFSKDFELWKNHTMYPKIKSILKHVLDEASWDDPDAVGKMSRSIIPFLEDEELRIVLVKKVKSLHLSYHYGFGPSFDKDEIPGLNALTNLKTLRIFNYHVLKNLNLEGLNQLERLTVAGCPNVSISGGADLQNLRDIFVDDQRQIPDSPSIKNITLSRHPGQEDFGRFIREKLPHLESVNFQDNSNEWEVRNDFHVKDLNILKKVSYYPSKNKDKLLNIKLENLPELESVDTRRAKDFHRYLGEVTLKNLPKIQSIELHEVKVASLNLHDMSSLKSLVAYQTEFIDLENLPSLAEMTIGPSTQSIMGFTSENLPNLTSFNANDAQKLSFLSFRDFNKIERIELINSSIESLDGLENLNSLKSLNLKNTQKLQSLYLKNLTQLDSLELRGSFVKELYLENLDSLHFLDLSNIPYLESITFRGSFKKLKTLWVAGSKNLKSIVGLENVEVLESLDARGSIPKQRITGLRSQVSLLADDHE